MEPYLKDFLSLATHEVLSKYFFAFFGAKTGVPSIPYGLHIQSCPIFLPFFEPKLEDLKLFEVGCPDLSWVSVLHTSWVKRWSEAKDFLQTFFLEKYFLLPISEKKFVLGQSLKG